MTLFEEIAQSRGKQLLVGGHRGHLSRVRENTLENFAEVAGLGLSHIEIDVQLSKDQVAMVYHDLDLGERSPLQGRVADYTAAELKAAFSINTLDECLAWCRKRELPAALEIKCELLQMAPTMPRLAEEIARSVEAHDFAEYSFIFGTDYRTLRHIKRLLPAVHLGLIVPFVPADPVRLMEEMEAEIYLCYIDNLCPDLVAQLHRAGYLVDGSVINSEGRLRQALALGVDLIESDHPEEMLPLCRQLEAQTNR